MYVEVQIVTVSNGVFLVGIDDRGQKSHDFFESKEQAMIFVAEFKPYHGCKLIEAKAADLAPETTQEKIVGYRADHSGCNCPDYVYRNGGSYIDADGNKCCKHMLEARKEPKKQQAE